MYEYVKKASPLAAGGACGARAASRQPGWARRRPRPRGRRMKRGVGGRGAGCGCTTFNSKQTPSGNQRPRPDVVVKGTSGQIVREEDAASVSRCTMSRQSGSEWQAIPAASCSARNSSKEVNGVGISSDQSPERKSSSSTAHDLYVGIGECGNNHKSMSRRIRAPLTVPASDAGCDVDPACVWSDERASKCGKGEGAWHRFGATKIKAPFCQILNAAPSSFSPFSLSSTRRPQPSSLCRRPHGRRPSFSP